MQHLTDELFNRSALSTSLTAVVLFETDWSGHCLIMSSILNKLETVYDGSMAFFKMDVEENPKTAGRFKIGRVPSILIFKHGNLIDRVTGMISESELLSRIRKVVEVQLEQSRVF